MPELTIKKLLDERKSDFEFTLLNSETGLSRTITNAELHRPGLALAGFFDRFPSKRTQILGESEISFLGRHSPEEIRQICARFFDQKV
ncbi:MAG TPA: hypothetical protein VLB27_05955, partial [candidate division Zixibacteria bacterium]|nr:hypothetical protein [candidate division Zixibacteria bacterium]